MQLIEIFALVEVFRCYAVTNSVINYEFIDSVFIYIHGVDFPALSWFTKNSLSTCGGFVGSQSFASFETTTQ